MLSCDIIGVGAWGPGFANWHELQNILAGHAQHDDALPKSPKPEVIPANERRRAPLPVKMAVEVSSQALAQAGVASQEVACVFGSGLGDTDITDYMCRVLTTEQKQLSPTKFHNSVHNAAAGYWTISTHCMKSANSVAAYYETAAASLLEAGVHSDQEHEPVLLTLFDTQAHAAYRDVFPCDRPFAAALLICPEGYVAKERVVASMEIDSVSVDGDSTTLKDNPLAELYIENPAARILPLLAKLSDRDVVGFDVNSQLQLKLSETSFLRIEIN